MKLKTCSRSPKKPLLLVIIKFLTIIIFSAFSVMQLTTSNVHAQPCPGGGLDCDSTTVLTSSDIAELKKRIANCPESIKGILDQTTVMDSNGNPIPIKEIDGTTTFISGIDSETKQVIYNSCPGVSDIEVLVVRVIVILISIVGAVLAFAIGKAAVTMIASSNDQKVFEEGAHSIRVSISATVGVMAFYIALVFVLTGPLGLGSDGKGGTYNIICQNQIVFSLVLDEAKPAC